MPRVSARHIYKIYCKIYRLIVNARLMNKRYCIKYGLMVNVIAMNGKCCKHVLMANTTLSDIPKYMSQGQRRLFWLEDIGKYIGQW